METKTKVTLFETSLGSWFLQSQGKKYGPCSTEQEAREFAQIKNLIIIDTKHPQYFSYNG